MERENRKGKGGTLGCNWLTLTGVHLVGVRAAGTLGLLLTAYDTVGRKEEERFDLCRWGADWVDAREKGLLGWLSVAFTVGEVAGSGALLL